jgi:hypothetical protein
MIISISTADDGSRFSPLVAIRQVVNEMFFQCEEENPSKRTKISTYLWFEIKKHCWLNNGVKTNISIPEDYELELRIQTLQNLIDFIHQIQMKNGD